MGKSELATIDNLLARYVSGTLPLPVNCVVQAHLELKADNRDFVDSLEEIAGGIVDSLTPVGLSRSAERLEAIMAVPDHDDPQSAAKPTNALLPASLASLVPYDLDSIPWRTKMPGYKECALGVIDGCDVNLLWIRAGRKMPSHTHEGSEITLVLDGAFADSRGRYGRGDIALADDEVDHRPIAEADRPCICLAITDAPLRLTGSYSQLFSDFIGR